MKYVCLLLVSISIAAADSRHIGYRGDGTGVFPDPTPPPHATSGPAESNFLSVTGGRTCKMDTNPD
jgi:hypothetical protein